MVKSGKAYHPLLERLLMVFETIRLRVLTLVIISVLAPSMLGGLLAVRYLSGVLQQQEFQTLSRTAERYSIRLSQWFSDRTSDVRAFTSSYLLNEDVRVLLREDGQQPRAKSKTSVERYMSYLLEDNHSFEGFAVHTGDGKILTAQPEGTDLGDGVGEILPSLGSDPRILEISDGGSSRIIIGQSLTDPSEDRVAFFIGIVRSEVIRKTLLEDLPSQSTAYIVDKSGIIKGMTDPRLQNRPLPPRVRSLLRTTGATEEFRGLSGEKVIGTAYALDVLPWHLVMETPSKKAFATLSSFRGQMMLMTISLAAILLIPAILLARTIILPLEELSRVAKRIRTGEAGLQVSTSPRGELGEFIFTFNRMSESLRLSMEEIQAINNQLRVMSVTDPLTGRYNRRYITDQVQRELKLARRTGQTFSLIMIDLDHFKDYNDRYGHIAGDETLRKVGDVLVENIRETDIVARWGGEEFLVYLSHADREGAAGIAEKLRIAVEQTSFIMKGKDTRVTISLGVAAAPEDGSNFDELIEHADQALYKAKRAGRNRAKTFSGQGSHLSSLSDAKRSKP
ncbi:MAG: GGDEF domain-containing protein [bacterium]|nr:MAG: GGDEF domain-containing protein [bacterium]